MASRNSNRRAVNKAGYKSSYSNLLAYGYRVRAFLIVNVGVFATPPITVAQQLLDLQALVFMLSFYTGKTTNRCSKAQLDNIKAAAGVVKSNLNILTAYVNNIVIPSGLPGYAQPGQFALSGMAIDKTRQPIGRLNPVQNLRQFISGSVANGDIKISWKRPAGAKNKKGYTYRVSLGANTVNPVMVDFATVTKTTVTITAADLNTLGLVSPIKAVITPVSPVLLSGSTGTTRAIGAPSPALTVAQQF